MFKIKIINTGSNTDDNSEGIKELNEFIQDKYIVSINTACCDISFIHHYVTILYKA